ncbi:hypothetical protein [Streptomyces sp. SYSU K217416]
MSNCYVCDNGRMRCVRERRHEERVSLPDCGILTESEVWAMHEAYEKPEAFDGDW